METTGEGEDDQGEGHEDVHDALEPEVEAAPEVGAGDAEDAAGGGADDGGDEAGEEGGAGTVDDAQQKVAAELVGAQEMLGAGRHVELAERVSRSGRRR